MDWRTAARSGSVDERPERGDTAKWRTAYAYAMLYVWMPVRVVRRPHVPRTHHSAQMLYKSNGPPTALAAACFTKGLGIDMMGGFSLGFRLVIDDGGDMLEGPGRSLTEEGDSGCHHGSTCAFSNSSLARSCCASSLCGSFTARRNFSRSAGVSAAQSSSYDAVSVRDRSVQHGARSNMG